jgi:hypothetical protein
MKTSNNQSIIDKMEFYVFTNFLIYLDEFIKKENSDENSDGEKQNEVTEQYKRQMNKTKADMFKNYKMPKIK